MGSLGTGELLVIAVVALIVFGPKRLPEIARKAGELLAKTREATKSVTSALDSEYDGITAPLQDLKREYDTTVKGFKDAASSATNFSVDLSNPPPDTKDTPEPPALPTETAPEADAVADSESTPPTEAESETDAVADSESTPPTEAESETDAVADSESTPPTDIDDAGKKPEDGA